MQTTYTRSSTWFLVNLLVLVAVVVPSTSATTDDDSVVHRFLDGLCKLEVDHPGTFKVTCSCKEEKPLTISSAITEPLPSTTTEFHIQDCNSSIVMLETGALNNFHSLENITFTSIYNLILESNSANLHLLHQQDFFITFESIMGLGLFLEEDAIKIQRDAETTWESLSIQNSIIKGLSDSAISGSFSELSLEMVILMDEAGTKAVDVGPVGAEVTISVLNASLHGLGPEWISGSVRALTITKSDLVLKPRAFASINMTGSQTPITIEMTDNYFGSPKWISGSKDTHSEPSLPSGVFNMDIPSAGLSITAENNKITCECEDLIWLLESPQGRLQSDLGFECIEGDLTSALDDCKHVVAPSNSSASINSVLGIFPSLAFMIMLI